MKHSDMIKNLEKHNQFHIINQLNSLTGSDLDELTSQINAIDWDFFSSLNNKDQELGHITPIDTLSLNNIKSNYSHFENIGLSSIKNGELAVLLLAGGQGTRLGFDKPKGTYNMGLTRELSIFQLLIQHALEVVKTSNTWIHFYIMTSDINYNETVTFFKEHDNWGYNSKYLHFFVQELNPCTDFNGNILMSSKSSLSLSPNGNGGWFSSMAKAGLLEGIAKYKIKWINVFAVDNVLQNIADPVFLGATIDSQLDCGAKVVKKAEPKEKVGVICNKNNKPFIVEYYEMTDDMAYQKNEAGDFSYGYGVILNYIFKVDKLINMLNKKMPLHVATKVVPFIDEKGELITPSEPNALKFETLALDMIYEMDSCLSFEVSREKEFAPVKNRVGVDSVDTARELLQKNGYTL